MKKCGKCLEIKELDDFSKNKNTKDKKTAHCRKCIKEYDQLNREKQLLYHKNKRINNLEEFKKYDKKYKSKNKQKQNEYNKKRWETNPQHKLRKTLRGRFWKAIKNDGIKFTSSINLIGCSIKFYKKYLESLFEKEMSWENHGKIWEIDHIIPCSSFDLTNLEEQQKCFNYKNTQPLFKTTLIAEYLGYKNYIGNRDKGDKNYE